MYWKDTYKSDNVIEYEIKYAGNYGAKGEKRAIKKKATPEQVKKQNQINKENRLRRTLQLNFYENDLWVCLKYPAGNRKRYKEVQNDFKKFVKRMRTEYKKRNEPFNYVYRIEIGKNGGMHIHILINRICGADLLCSKCWPHHIHFTNVREEGGMSKLASYITKPLPEETEQLSFISEEDKKRCASYGTSRNLKRPEPERKTYKRRTVRKLVTEGPTATKGFYIDKDSITQGINPYTGYTYYRYRELRLNPVKRKLKPPENLKPD